ELLERIPHKDSIALYNLACAYSLESAAVGQLDGNRSPEDLIESRRSADLAIAALRQAFLAGWKDVGHTNQDTDLDPLRPRPDFQVLMMDMAFPDHPFAR